MPFINTKVNMPLTKDQKDTIKTKLGQAIKTIPGKSENWLMVGFEDDVSLYFQGRDDDKIAFIDVKIFGRCPEKAMDEMTGVLCRIYQETLGISPDKIYIDYQETAHWGFNGSNL